MQIVCVMNCKKALPQHCMYPLSNAIHDFKHAYVLIANITKMHAGKVMAICGRGVVYRPHN